MHTIVSIEKSQKKEDVAIITLSNGDRLRCTLFSVVQAGFKAGDELSPRQITGLTYSLDKTKVRRKAANILSYRNYSTKGLEKRLMEKGIEKEQAEEAVTWLATAGMIDDEAYAKSLFKSLCNQHYGPRHIRYAMEQKGVTREMIEGLRMDEFDFLPVIDAFILKKSRKAPLDKQEQRKLSDALYRRGHRFEDIQTALRQLCAKDEQDDYE